jgi:hypothetical protein
MPETANDALHEAAERIRADFNERDPKAGFLLLVAGWLETWEGLNIPDSAAHSDDYDHAVAIARAYLQSEPSNA